MYPQMSFTIIIEGNHTLLVSYSRYICMIFACISVLLNSKKSYNLTRIKYLFESQKINFTYVITVYIIYLIFFSFFKDIINKFSINNK